MVVFAFGRFRRSVEDVFGKETGRCLVVLVAVQFHLAFYMSRSLPNTFALAIGMLRKYHYSIFGVIYLTHFILVLIGLSKWIKGEIVQMIACFTFATVVFRSEIIVLFGPILLDVLLRKQLNIMKMSALGILFGSVSLGT